MPCPRCEGDTKSQLSDRRTLHSDKDEAEKHSIGIVWSLDRNPTIRVQVCRGFGGHRRNQVLSHVYLFTRRSKCFDCCMNRETSVRMHGYSHRLVPSRRQGRRSRTTSPPISKSSTGCFLHISTTGTLRNSFKHVCFTSDRQKFKL